MQRVSVGAVLGSVLLAALWPVRCTGVTVGLGIDWEPAPARREPTPGPPIRQGPLPSPPPSHGHAAQAALALGGHRAGRRALAGSACSLRPAPAAAARPGPQLRRRGVRRRSCGPGERPAPQAHAVSGSGAGRAADGPTRLAPGLTCNPSLPVNAAPRSATLTGTPTSRAPRCWASPSRTACCWPPTPWVRGGVPPASPAPSTTLCSNLTPVPRPPVALRRIRQHQALQVV